MLASLGLGSNLNFCNAAAVTNIASIMAKPEDTK